MGSRPVVDSAQPSPFGANGQLPPTGVPLNDVGRQLSIPRSGCAWNPTSFSLLLMFHLIETPGSAKFVIIH